MQLNGNSVNAVTLIGFSLIVLNAIIVFIRAWVLLTKV